MREPPVQWGNPALNFLIILGIIGGALWFAFRRKSEGLSGFASFLGIPSGYVARRLGLRNDEFSIRYLRGPAYAYNMGLRYAGIGEYETAAGYFLHAVDLHPEWAEARYQLGLAYSHMKRFADATQQHDALLSLNPNLAEQLKMEVGKNLLS